jgi:hypothetical protein
MIKAVAVDDEPLALAVIRKYCDDAALIELTAHAVKGFELAAVDYLVKPIRYERFVMALRRAIRWHTMPEPGMAETGEEYITAVADEPEKYPRKASCRKILPGSSQLHCAAFADKANPQ